jgi:hypothetical protein
MAILLLGPLQDVSLPRTSRRSCHTITPRMQPRFLKPRRPHDPINLAPFARLGVPLSPESAASPQLNPPHERRVAAGMSLPPVSS